MIGFVLGIVLGLVLGPRAEVLKPLGTILTNLLTMVVAPLVFTLLVCAAADVGDGKRLGRIGIKTVIIFLVSTALAIVLGLVVSNMMNIGAGVELSNVAAPQPKGQAPASMLDTVINIIPVNIFASLAKQNLLQIIFFALIMGFALLKLGDKGKPLLDCCRAGQEVMKEITNMALEFTPYGVLGLMASVVGEKRDSHPDPLHQDHRGYVSVCCGVSAGGPGCSDGGRIRPGQSPEIPEEHEGSHDLCVCHLFQCGHHPPESGLCKESGGG